MDVQEGKGEACRKGSQVGLSASGVSVPTPGVSQVAVPHHKAVCPPLTCSQATGGAITCGGNDVLSLREAGGARR